MKQIIEDLMVLSLEAQVVHWKTDSYAIHIATKELYNGLRKYTDSLVEALRGTEDIDMIIPNLVTANFNNLTPINIIENMNYHLSHFEGLEPSASGIQNIIDDICTLLRTSIYKLTYLS